MRTSIVCTLFEGNYHYGVGALANSLYKNGFRGTIWAGYRGKLPSWATPLTNLKGFYQFFAAPDCTIHFIPLDTPHHFTNFKPHFILHLYKKFCLDADSIFYFDPDITIKCSWSFYEQWINYGIALCQEIVYSNMPSNHPVRQAWKEFANRRGYYCHRNLNQYFNGGFIGLKTEYISAISTWKQLLDDINVLDKQPAGLKRKSPLDLFYSVDQDALNLMAMITPHQLSTIGPEGMDFVGGGYTMSHATGSPKPWNKKFTYDVLNGKPLSLADKEYWKNVSLPIQLYSSSELFQKRMDLLMGSLIKRFLR